jgi:hypothetical protein
MRCTERVKVYFKETVIFTEFNDEGVIENMNVERWTYIWQQCPTTTKIKTARCWKRWGICGQHAAKRYPELYVKAKGSSTGGRMGKSQEPQEIENPLIIPALLV